MFTWRPVSSRHLRLRVSPKLKKIQATLAYKTRVRQRRNGAK